MTKSKKIIIFLLSILIFSNCFVLPISSTSLDLTDYNNEWHIEKWYEIYNITKDMKVYGWTIIKIDLLQPNATNDHYLVIDLPAKNNSITYYFPNLTGISLKSKEINEGVSVIFSINKSTFKICYSFEIAFNYIVRDELFINQKSQWFESLIRFRVETQIKTLNGILSNKDEKLDSSIVNIYISLNDEATITKPEKFSIVSKDSFPDLTYLYAINRTAIDKNNFSEIFLDRIILPKIKPNENNTLLISYIGDSPPGSVLFEFSFTNLDIVRLTVAAVILGMISSFIAISEIAYKIYKRHKNKNDRSIQSSSNNEEIHPSYKINTITSININRVEKLDSLLLAVPSLFGIIGIIIPLFANALVEQGLRNIFINEILYYFTIPILFFAVFMPLYIGYWRGAIITSSITERVRGWIFVILGSFMYILPISFLVISTIFTLLFSNNLVLVFVVNLSMIILYVIIIRKQMKKIHYFIKNLFILYGEKECTKKDEYFAFRTYLTAFSFAIFFYVLFYSLSYGKLLNSSNLLYVPIRLIGVGVPILYFGLNEEKITSNYLKNISLSNSFFLRKKIKIFFILLLLFSIFSIITLFLDIFFTNLLSELLFHICVGILLFSGLTWVTEQLNLKYIEHLTKNENRSINEIDKIKGIGQKTIMRLENAGITTIKKLDEMDIKDLTSIKGIGDKTAKLIKKI